MKSARLSILLLLATLTISFSCVSPARRADSKTFESAWGGAASRTWVGPSYWANRLQDWRLAEGRLECLADARRLPMRTVHLLTHRLGSGPGEFDMDVLASRIPAASAMPSDAAAGFLVGVGGTAMDYRAAAIVHDVPGPGGGLFAGINGRGEPFIIDNATLWDRVPVSDASDADAPPSADKVALRLRSTTNDDGTITLSLSTRHAPDAAGREATLTVPAERLVGGVALVSHPGARPGQGPGGRFAFEDWTLSGSRVDADASRELGPILSTQYTLSEGVMKMTAQMMPLGEDESDEVILQTRTGGDWKTVATTTIVRPGFTAPFRVAEWDATKDTPYRVTYDLALGGGRHRTCTREGVVRRDPVDKETIVVAGFTGNHNNSHTIAQARRQGAQRRPFDWTTGMWFPQADLTARVGKHAPDVLFFSGDQVYEGNSPSFADGAHIKLDYLYKWYLWCWAYRDLTRDIPTVTMPDDHDVYQGNLWGEGGRKTDKDDKGGYVHPADFVKMSERTQTSHLPDPVDPRPLAQGIGVYFTHMKYGRIGFAILEDRKFKSGCNGRVEGKTRGRADHINDAEFDMRKADTPGLKLLGDRQIAFLEDFAADWSGEDMKIALSQTIFANMATHHGGGLFRLIADLDSNGWPQSGRKRALSELRRGFVFHLAGDQHLASLVHHGIDEHNDAIWSFCVPSVANFYPRAWKPEAEGQNRPPGAPPNMGEHIDGLGNKVTVFAVTNPTQMTGKSTGVEPLDLHDKMPGYGIVKLNKRTREITMECWPRYVDPDDPTTGTQYTGWPKTVSQLSNYDRKPAAYLPTIACSGMDNPVVQVLEEASGKVLYTLRIRGTSFRPMVFRPGKYTISVGEPGTDRYKTLRGVESLAAGDGKTLQVEF